MISKLNKHLTILQSRLNKKRTINQIQKVENETLQKIINAFLMIQDKNIEKHDNDNFKKCEDYREKLLNDNTEISYEVFNSDRKAKVNDICRKAASSKEWAQFFYLISKQIDQPTFLEIGTNVGLSGTYILNAIKDKEECKFITMEGLPQLCELSSNQFKTICDESKFEVIQGLYDSTFPKIMDRNISFNIMFIDGNHQKEPTIQYFKDLKDKISSPAIFIFDDINWSKGMKECWNEISRDKDVNYSIDFYKLGILIIDKEDKKKGMHFNLHLTY